MKVQLAIAVSALAVPAGAQQMLPYEDAAAVAQGAQIYAEYCAVCHGSKLEGQVEDWRSPDADGYMPAPPHDETGHTWHHADALLVRITKYGTEAIVGGDYRSNMGGFGDVLSDREILNVLAYIKSTWPERVVQIHNQINAQSQ
jgi:mono/diheme cytochrome c family protein